MKSKMLLYVFIILFCTLFLTGCTSKEDVEYSKDFVEEGLELYESREYKKAVDKFIDALEKYPASFDAYIGITKIFLDKGLFDDVEDLAKEASIRIDKSETAEIYSMIGDKYYEIGDYSSAEKAYEQALKHDNDHEGSKIGLASVNIQNGEINNAQKVLGKDGESVEFFLLYAYLALDDWEKGSGIVNDLDLNEIEDSLIKEKVSSLREIYALDDEDALYKNTSLAGQYVNSGYPYLAIKLLNDQGSNLEEYPDAQYFLGKAYLDFGDYERAKEKLNNAVLLDMKGPDLHVNLARAYLADSNVERAIDSYKLALSTIKIETAVPIVTEYVTVLTENNMLNSAKNHLRELINEKDLFDLNIMLADIFYKQKDLKSMNEVLTKLEKEANLTQSETRDLTRYKILYAMEEISDVEEIEALIERYTVFDRYNPEIFLFKGMLLKYEEKNSEAKEALERAIELDLDGDVTDQANKLLATVD